MKNRDRKGSNIQFEGEAVKLKVVYEQEDLTIGRDSEGQLYVGGVHYEDGTENETRSFQKIQSYALKFNGEQVLDSYVLEDGSRVRTLDDAELSSIGSLATE